MKKSIRQDLSIRIGLVILCISLVIGVIYYSFSIYIHEKEFNKSIGNYTNYISDTFTLQLWLFDLNTTRKLCKLLLNSPDISGLRLLDHKGNVVFEQEPASQVATIHIKRELRHEGKIIVGSVDIYYTNTSWVEHRVNIFLIGILMVLGIIAGAFVFINILLKRYLSKPLADLQKDMELLSQGDFQQSDLVNQKTEIQTIINAFNELTMSLKQRDKEISLKTEALGVEILEREHTEKLLRSSKEQWERTFNAMNDMVTIQNNDMQILQANKATYDFFQLPEKDVIGKYCYELFRGSSQPCSGCPEFSNFADSANYSANITHDNLGKFFHVSMSPIMDERGVFTRIVHIARDITGQKKMEEDLFQAHKMEAIGTLAGGIAHDFNNILAVILGYADMVKDDLAKGSRAKDDINQILMAANRAKELVKQILTFSRKGQETLQPLLPVPVIKESLKLMRASLPTTIEIDGEIDSDCGLILANPTNIHQVLVNLCTNAHHAMEDEKGVLTVSLTQVELTKADIINEPGASGGSFVELMVSDTGCGMDKTTFEHIFEPYFTTKGIGKGTGMGLALVHGIVKDCGGYIKVESELRKGSAFHIYFPVIEEQGVGVEKKQQELLPRGTERILMVDDDLVICTMQKAYLQTLGYSVTMTTESKDALNLLRTTPDSFDLLITDQTMPNITGIELASAILEKRPGFPVLLCTGYSSMVSETKAREVGIKAFKMKPVARKDMAMVVRCLLDGSRYL